MEATERTSEGMERKKTSMRNIWLLLIITLIEFICRFGATELIRIDIRNSSVCFYLSLSLRLFPFVTMFSDWACAHCSSKNEEKKISSTCHVQPCININFDPGFHGCICATASHSHAHSHTRDTRYYSKKTWNYKKQTASWLSSVWSLCRQHLHLIIAASDLYFASSSVK